MANYDLSYGVRFTEVFSTIDGIRCIPITTLNGEDQDRLKEIIITEGDELTIHNLLAFNLAEKE